MAQEQFVDAIGQNVKKDIYYLLVLDKSGSMSSTKQETISGFNEIVQTIKSESENNNFYVTLIQFNQNVEVTFENTKAENLVELTDKSYQPDGSTAMNDAIADGIKMLETMVSKDANVLINIFTDGGENASKRFSTEEVKKMIEESTAKKWTVSWMGFDGSLETATRGYGISKSNFASFDANIAGSRSSNLRKMSDNISSYSARTSLGMDTQDFYVDEETQNQLKEQLKQKKSK